MNHRLPFFCKSGNIHRLKPIHFIVKRWKILSCLNYLPYKRAQKKSGLSVLSGPRNTIIWLNCTFHRQGKSGATRYKQQGMFFNDTETTTATASLKVMSGTRTIYSWGLVKKRRYSKAFDFRKRAEIRQMAAG